MHLTIASKIVAVSASIAALTVLSGCYRTTVRREPRHEDRHEERHEEHVEHEERHDR